MINGEGIINNEKELSVLNQDIAADLKAKAERGESGYEDHPNFNKIREDGDMIGTVVTTIHGNKLRRFEDGWSPLEGAHWDRWTVYTDAELIANFTITPNTR